METTKYFAFQDTAAGFIQWVGAGKDEIEVATAFKNDVKFEQTPEEMLEDLEVTELTLEQYKKLEDVAGDDQDAIDYLESIK